MADRFPAIHSRAALRRIHEGESVRTIFIALGANLLIAAAKFVAGLLSHSTAMLAEAAHSVADSLNEIFLGISLRRARKPPDATHPLGHGREEFLWALLAAIASFLIGGCFSIFMAIHSLTSGGGEKGHRLIAWIVLGVSFVADGISWMQSMRQARNQAREYGLAVWQYLRRASEPLVRAVVVEDSAALIGLVLAAAGLLISALTGSTVPDAIASLLIGILLAVTAFGLARPLADFLVGRSLSGERLDQLRSIIEASPAIERIESMHAVYSGPEEAIVAAKVVPKRDLTIEELTRAMDDLDRGIRAASALVADVYLDMTGRSQSPTAREPDGVSFRA